MRTLPAVWAYYGELEGLQRRAAAAAAMVRDADAARELRAAIARRGEHMDEVAASLVLATALTSPWGRPRTPAPPS